MELTTNNKSNIHLFEEIFDTLSRKKAAIKCFKFISHFFFKYGRCTTKQGNEAEWGREFNKECVIRTIGRYTKEFRELGLIETKGTGRALIKKLTEKGIAFFKWLKSWSEQQKNKLSDQLSDRKRFTIYKNHKNPNTPPPVDNSEGPPASKGFMKGVFKKIMGKKMNKRLPREVSMQINKRFHGNNAKAVEEAISKCEGSVGYLVYLIEDIATGVNSMRKQGRLIDSLEAYVIYKHKKLKSNYDNADFSENYKYSNKNEYYGLSRQYIEKHARRGETYESAARRLAGKGRLSSEMKYNPWMAYD